MESRFEAGEWQRLTPRERVARCRLLAEDARQSAALATSDAAKQMYCELAANWEKLAAEIETFERL